MNTTFSKLDYIRQGARTRTKPGSIVCDWPLWVRHCVCVCCRSLLMDVATRPLLHLPKRVHHAWVCTRMPPLEALVPVRGRNYSTGLRGVWLHPHVWSIRGIALGNILKRETWAVISGFQWMLNKSTAANLPILACVGCIDGYCWLGATCLICCPSKWLWF